MAISPAAICALGACGAPLLYILYLRLLPKPHPGIPYNKEALTSLLGDLPIARRESKGNFSKWMADQAPRHNSPIVQLFLQPFHKPAILICDYREAQDILVRRKEFDRSDTDIAILSGMSDHFHMNLKTNETWKTHRRLIQHLMSPEFLHGVAAPKIYKSAVRLLELWEIKRQISEGKAFAADGDIFHATLDAIDDFTFGDAFEGRLLPPQIKILKSLDEKQLLQLRGNSKNSDQFHFEPAPVDGRSNLLLHALDLLTTMAATGIPRLAWRVAMLVPGIRRDRDARRNIIKEQVIKGIARLEDESNETEDTEVKCAVDHMLRQERNMAAKDGRKPVYWSPTMRDEVLGFVIAGHDTTSTTFCWALKFLSDNPASQSRLRKTLQLSYPSAFTSRCLPTADEMTSASIPYLDIFVEEVLRIAHTIGAQNRNTTEDTVILGHAIPKGTQVFFGNRGPGFVAPPLPIDESVRSETSQAALREGRVRHYDDKMWYGGEDMHGDVFEPARWLVTNPETGREAFDAVAWPTMPFGAGRRGCYGRKLAYMKLKMVLTLLVWKFEFCVCPEDLSGYERIQIFTSKPQKTYISLRPVP